MNPELAALAAKIYVETKSGNKVAARLDVSHSTAYRLLAAAGVLLPDRHGAEVNERKRKLDGAKAEVVANDYANGMSVKAMIRLHGVGRHAIGSAAAAHGVPIRAKGGRIKILTLADLVEATRLYSTGFSQQQIAASMKIGLNVINRAMRQAGVKMRQHRATGSDHGSWRGGRIDARGGYVGVLLSADDALSSMRNGTGYVLEHRLVMARAIGRALTSTETVHHIDGDKGNTALSNLQLRFGQHGKGVAMVCGACGSRDVVCVTLD